MARNTSAGSKKKTSAKRSTAQRSAKPTTAVPARPRRQRGVALISESPVDAAPLAPQETPWEIMAKHLRPLLRIRIVEGHDVYELKRSTGWRASPSADDATALFNEKLCEVYGDAAELLRAVTWNHMMELLTVETNHDLISFRNAVFSMTTGQVVDAPASLAPFDIPATADPRKSLTENLNAVIGLLFESKSVTTGHRLNTISRALLQPGVN